MPDDLRQLAGDHQHRPRPSGELVDDPVDFRLGADIDAAGRLVQDQHLGLVSSQRDSSTFCWLPPDRLPTPTLALATRILSSSIEFSPARSPCGEVEHAAAARHPGRSR